MRTEGGRYARAAVVPVAKDGQNLFGSAIGDGQRNQSRAFDPRQRGSGHFKCRNHRGCVRDACRTKTISDADESEEGELN